VLFILVVAGVSWSAWYEAKKTSSGVPGEEVGFAPAGGVLGGTAIVAAVVLGVALLAGMAIIGRAGGGRG